MCLINYLVFKGKIYLFFTYFRYFEEIFTKMGKAKARPSMIKDRIKSGNHSMNPGK